MESRHGSATDGISRFLSLLAILVALGSAVFLYQNNQRLKMELDTIKGTTNDPQVFKDHAQAWDTKLTSALTEFGKRAKVETDKFDRAREARNNIVGAASDLTNGLGEEEVKEIVDKRLADVVLPTPAPQLLVAQTVLRPGKVTEPPLPRIRNNGTVEAEISVAKFKPKLGSVFSVEAPVEPAENQVVIEFDPTHNVGADPGYHRFYERSYTLPEQVVARKETVEVLVEIRANGEHLDWGMMGDLELQYQDGRTVLIPNARAVFVADKETTT